jgi:hypothetical protein
MRQKIVDNGVFFDWKCGMAAFLDKSFGRPSMLYYFCAPQ